MTNAKSNIHDVIQSLNNFDHERLVLLCDLCLDEIQKPLVPDDKLRSASSNPNSEALALVKKLKSQLHDHKYADALKTANDAYLKME